MATRPPVASPFFLLLAAARCAARLCALAALTTPHAHPAARAPPGCSAARAPAHRSRSPPVTCAPAAPNAALATLQLLLMSRRRGPIPAAAAAPRRPLRPLASPAQGGLARRSSRPATAPPCSSDPPRLPAPLPAPLAYHARTAAPPSTGATRCTP
nr:translation initiation factor IF-2-like [Aegilops tauschii subsp. strangulata]